MEWSGPFIKLEWSLMLFDNSWTSLLFLLRLREGTRTTARLTPRISIPLQVTGLFVVRTPRVSKPCSGLIAVSKLVIPVALNLAQIIFAFFNPTNLLDGFIVLIVNLNVQIIGVLFATVWCASTRWYEDSHKAETPGIVITSVRFADNAVLTASGAIVETIHDRNEDPSMHTYGHRSNDKSRGKLSEMNA
ncbi:hypothetical protein C8Q74DRAFT_121362 [Fomes fomentarius]|nr:hypothetical protein C8Q74DRAFT_121362 [Fomes fomentarius]